MYFKENHIFPITNNDIMNHQNPYSKHIALQQSSSIKLAFFIILLVIAPQLSAQRGITRTIPIESGMIRAIFQDQSGIMWIGTEGGLYRYDGYDLHLFSKIIGDSTSLSSKAINTITQDHLGNLWVGTGMGLNQLDLQTEKIKKVHFIDSISIQTGHSRINHLLVDTMRQKMWIGSDAGFCNIDLAKLDTAQAPNYSLIPFTDAPHANHGKSLFLDSDQNIWFGTRYGFGKYFPSSGKVEFKHAGTQKRYTYFIEDEEEFIWTSSSLHIEVFHKQNPQEPVKIIPLGDYGKVEERYDVPLWKAPSGQLWAIPAFGTLRLDTRQKKIGQIININDNVNAFCSASYQDASGLFWLATQGGIHLVNLTRQRFLNYKFPKEESSGKSDTSIRAIYVDSSGTTWLGTQGSGLFFISPNESTPKRFIIKSQLPTYDLGEIRSITEDQDQNLWLATRSNGLLKIDPSRTLIRQFDLPAYVLKEVESNIIYTLMTDDQGYLWIGTWNYILRFDTKKESFLYTTPIPDLPLATRTLAQDSSRMIWIGTWGTGLLKFHPDSIQSKNPSLQPVPIEGPDHNYGIYKRINHILPDQNGVIWLSTYGGGLVQMFTQQDSFAYFNTSNSKMQDDIIYGVLKDRKGLLWFSSNNGISQFNPSHGSIWNFDVRDGLQNNEFNSGVCFQSSDGAMHFGGISGLNSFSPENIKVFEYKPPIVFTKFYVNNEVISPGEHSTLKRHINQTQKITLRHDQSDLSFEIASLDYHIPEKNQYAYKLEPKDDDWNYSGNRRFFSYTNLKPGGYVLKIKGSNHDGVWSDVKSIRLRIKYPALSNPIAWITYFFLGFGIIYHYYGVRKSRRQAKKEAQLLKEQDELKTKLYTEISHEIRTPLTVITGMAIQILRDPQVKVTEAAELIRRNSDLLLDLVNQILELRKLTVGAEKLHLTKEDVLPFLRYVFESFLWFAKTKQIQMHLLPSVNHLEMDFDREKLQRIVSNLLHNAIKFTPENGHIYLQIDEKVITQDPFLELRIKDTGEGIPKEKLCHIFEEFQSSDGSGTGIGLALAQRLVQLMNGKIKVESSLQKGTEFIVNIPITKNATPAAPSPVLDSSPKHPDQTAVKPTDPIKNPIQLKESGNPIVLVVEDNADVRIVLQRWLQLRYRLIFAENGVQGVKIALHEVPDLIISDVMMPEKDGFALCGELKTNLATCHIPIILLTAKADVHSLYSGLEQGADAYLKKPVDPTELLIRIEKLLESRDQLRKKYNPLEITKSANYPPLTKDDQFTEKLKKVILKNLHEENFRIESLSRKMQLSRSQLYRKAIALYGKPPSQLIKDQRLKKARHLLLTTDITIKEIAFHHCGFTSLSTFSDQYLDRYNERPSETRKTLKIKLLDKKSPS